MPVFKKMSSEERQRKLEEKQAAETEKKAAKQREKEKQEEEKKRLKEEKEQQKSENVRKKTEKKREKDAIKAKKNENKKIKKKEKKKKGKDKGDKSKEEKATEEKEENAMEEKVEADKTTPEHEAKESPKLTEKDSAPSTPKKSPKSSPKSSPDSLKKPAKESPKISPKVSPKIVYRETTPPPSPVINTGPPIVATNALHANAIVAPVAHVPVPAPVLAPVQAENVNSINPPSTTATTTTTLIGKHRNENEEENGMSDDSGVVRLNVGGTWYTTTRATLQTYPESMFPRMLAQRSGANNKKATRNEADNNKGYYFIDRDGGLFRYVLNYMRTQQLALPSDFSEYEQLINEAEFYGLRTLANMLRVRTTKEKRTGKKCALVEIVETAHPERIGVCSARIVVSEEMKYKAPFAEVVDNMPPYFHEEYQGQFGRYWIRTNLTRLAWAERLLQAGWNFMGTTSICRRLPDVTGKGTDLCHIVEKWCLEID